ncbi:MAG: hypothetical protein H7256_04755, partial [Bdellovibrio sp.]|nr:hypothetical protein [Bdellovibrio sp.]
EGTQLALDGELLTPLSTLAKSAMTEDDCGGNKSEAAQNGNDEIMGAFVINTLKQLCK